MHGALYYTNCWAPTPQAPPSLPALKRQRSKTIVLRWIADKRFSANFAKIQANPGKLARNWIACLDSTAPVRIFDSWGWELQPGADGHNSVIKGLFRVEESVAANLLLQSGRSADNQRWFVEKLGRDLLAVAPFDKDLAVQWVEKQEQETEFAYATRVAKLASQLGVARGVRQLGVRRVATAADKEARIARSRRWKAVNVPREYGYEDMEELLQGMGFQHVDITEKFRWRNRNGWAFRAAFANSESMVEATADDGTIVSINEIKFVNKEKMQKRCTALPRERVTSFKSFSSSAGINSNDGDLAPEDEGLAEHKEGEKKRSSATENPTNKRARVGPPEGFLRVANDGGGNCLFHAIAKAIEEEGRSRTHLQLRAMCVSHMQRHLATYAGYWDGKEPTKEGAPMTNATFTDYVQRVAQPGAWCGYTELHAMACTMDRPILVVRPSNEGAWNFHIFNPDGANKQITLWYESEHYMSFCKEKICRIISMNGRLRPAMAHVVVSKLCCPKSKPTVIPWVATPFDKVAAKSRRQSVVTQSEKSTPLMVVLSTRDLILSVAKPLALRTENLLTLWQDILQKMVIPLVHRLQELRRSLENLLHTIPTHKHMILKARTMFGPAIFVDGRSEQPHGGLAPEAARITLTVLILILPVA